MDPKMTEIYFNFAGQAKPGRVALDVIGEEWVDYHITGQQVVVLKPSIDPTDPFEAAYADIAADAVIDSHLKLVSTMIEKDPAKKMELRRAMAEEFLPMWLGNLGKNLKATGGEYFAGGKLSTGGIAVVCRIEWYNNGTLDGIPAGIMDGYPLLSALMKRVYKEPRIMAYKQKRAEAAAAK